MNKELNFITIALCAIVLCLMASGCSIVSDLVSTFEKKPEEGVVRRMSLAFVQKTPYTELFGGDSSANLGVKRPDGSDEAAYTNNPFYLSIGPLWSSSKSPWGFLTEQHIAEFTTKNHYIWKTQQGERVHVYDVEFSTMGAYHFVERVDPRGFFSLFFPDLEPVTVASWNPVARSTWKGHVGIVLRGDCWYALTMFSKIEPHGQDALWDNYNAFMTAKATQ